MEFNYVTGCAKLSAIGIYFSQKTLKIKVYKSMSGKYEKISSLVFKTNSHKVSYTTFQVNSTLIKHSLKCFIE